ncbi:T9SS type A sorting domain-containing protein [bacterium]|nr:T9SS type A sorting domain-containing protein [bacterium]
MRIGKFVLRSMWILLATAVPLFAQHVMLNEILYDTIGEDDLNIMYTELYGPPGTDLDGYTLVGLCGGNMEYLVVVLSGTIPADGYFVVGGAGVDNVDQIYPHDWQNGGYQGIGCNCIHLRYQGNSVDRVRYGECEPGLECEGEGEGSAPDAYPPTLNYSIGRLPDHQDTDDNAADWHVLDYLSPGEPNDGGPCEIHYYTLIDVQQDNADGIPLHIGEFVHVSGIASVSNYVFDPSTSNFYIQDEDAGVNIFGSHGAVNAMQGDCVTVEGWVSHYNGLTEIASSGHGNCVWELDIVDHVDDPDPITITCNTVSYYGENYEGMLVLIDGVSITGGEWPSEGENANLDISDGTGTCIMRIDRDTDIDGQPQLPDPFVVVGILTQYDNTIPHTEGYQILPRSYYDLLSPTDELAIEIPKGFKLLGCYPNPFNARTKIVFTVAHPAVVSIQIFDLLGRQVMKSSIAVSSPGEHVYIWNGTNQTGETVGAGLYFVRLTAGRTSETGKLLFLK